MELDEDSETSTYGLQNRCSAAELIQLIDIATFLTLALVNFRGYISCLSSFCKLCDLILFH